MLTPDENERLTRVGPGTPMGTLFRRYWLPFAIAEELPEADGAPIRVRLLGEDLVAFRDSDGKVGLVDAFCPHRRAPMFFGRNEELGLRCVYHGWKFDRAGTCIDMPSEPPDSFFKTKVRIASYPTWEGGRMLWAYLGPPEHQPPPPDYEFLRAPETHRFLAKSYEECNYLQALEGGLDTAHISFLHNISIKNKNRPRTADSAPRLEIERTDYGFRYAGIRQFENRQYVRTNHYLMPAQQSRGHVIGSDGLPAPIGTIHGHIWVPIDDTHTYAYSWMYAYDPKQALPPEFVREYESYAGRGPESLLPGFRPLRNRSNDYLIDRALQKNESFTGIFGINTQDFAIQEGMGPICDRTREHLGTTDRAVIAARQLLLEAVTAAENGETVPGADPASHRYVRAVDNYIPKDAAWQVELKEDMVAKF
jgi:phenylpropionate dioxygenase-like ring-hydroxylating dioxygenase large terminal subunit